MLEHERVKVLRGGQAGGVEGEVSTGVSDDGQAAEACSSGGVCRPQ